MAITRIHAIKATVDYTIKYICNPDKTDGETLIFSQGTLPECAAATFNLMLQHTDKNDPNLAYHLIQSFAPGEVDSKEAHEIGKELAERLLGGRYAYVLTTHTDKDHCHNHLCFCAANSIDFKKFHSCKKSYYDIRRISDELCKEHGLSVIREEQHKSKFYKEWLSDKHGQSWKTQLRQDINECIKQSHIYADFVMLMQAKGYEVRDSGFEETDHKYISFRAPGYSRWVRGKAGTLGTEYTKERIRERIENKGKIRSEKALKNASQSTSFIDTSDAKFQESEALMRWAKRQNMKAAARIQSLLAEKKLDNYEALDQHIESLHQQARNSRKATVALDKEIAAFEKLLHYARVYSENKRYLKAYAKSKDPDRYYRTHGDQIEMATGALHHLKNASLDPNNINLVRLENDYKQMKEDRARTYNSYQSADKECTELRKLRDDLLSYTGARPSPEKELEQKRTL